MSAHKHEAGVRKYGACCLAGHCKDHSLHTAVTPCIDLSWDCCEMQIEAFGSFSLFLPFKFPCPFCPISFPLE